MICFSNYEACEKLFHEIFRRPRSIIHFSSKTSDSQLIFSVDNKFNQFGCHEKLTRFCYFEENDMRELCV